MARFGSLTVGEIARLTDEDVERYAFEVGDEMLDDISTRQAVAKIIGARRIREQIETCKKVVGDLSGE